jgi:hypothetical protein
MTNTIEGNNSVGSLLKPLLKVTPIVGSRMLCSEEVVLLYDLEPTVLLETYCIHRLLSPLRCERELWFLPLFVKLDIYNDHQHCLGVSNLELWCHKGQFRF